jgi:nicotinamide riboside transporter PnuC
MNQYFIYAFIAFLISCCIGIIQTKYGHDSDNHLTLIGNSSGLIASIASCASCVFCVKAII